MLLAWWTWGIMIWFGRRQHSSGWKLTKKIVNILIKVIFKMFIYLSIHHQFAVLLLGIVPISTTTETANPKRLYYPRCGEKPEGRIVEPIPTFVWWQEVPAKYSEPSDPWEVHTEKKEKKSLKFAFTSTMLVLNLHHSISLAFFEQAVALIDSALNQLSTVSAAARIEESWALQWIL